MRSRFIGGILILVFAAGLFGWTESPALAKTAKARYIIVASDTILSGMAKSLLPPARYSVLAILPPGQCPGHYDVKLSDIEKMQKADLVISFSRMPFLEKANSGGRARLALDTGGRNWMAPESYLFGLQRLAGELARRFPDDRDEIARREKGAVSRIRAEAQKQKARLDRAGIAGRALLASSLQQETLEWMGFSVAGVYGRPEALSAKDVARLIKIGRERQIAAVVDNLQSGPDAGKGLAEALGRPHVVLNNFPSSRGYLATLQDNVDAVITALEKK
ncbi:MAG: metal ABC transporter substrate-binding protein [Smithellaceae bacterium]|nr:zinc ABC transporter substrate-binding protein [Syntrophaceae bacterium]MDD4241529.1 metal ABC transporter substrate-binding protein [Smithellaceae bacterium]NLX51804.1 zinc ABC transporter substrate-binding protein [Deltaproteobacteria bacterium]